MAGTRLATRPRVLRRSSLALILGGILLSPAGDAAAQGWLGSGSLVPIEARVAVAAGPDRTTSWTSLRFQGAAGPAGMVVAVPPGATLDWSSDAWLEALEIATAPRVFPPAGVSATCPGEPEDKGAFHLAGSADHDKSLAPEEALVLADAGAVAAWAAAHGLSVSPALADAMAAQAGARFFVARFTTAAGASVTPTLRVVAPGAAPVLPLALTRAAGADLRVTAWLVGHGRGDLAAAPPASLAAEELSWDAAAAQSNYVEVRAGSLATAGAGAALLEAAGHDALAYNVAIAGGTASIDGVVTTYFERALAYQAGGGDPAACIAQAAAALASTSPVAASCPRADLGVVDGVPSCAESPVDGETDPDKLRCTGDADDLAVALSGLIPAAAWLSRYTLVIAAGSGGAVSPVAFAGAPAKLPVLDAASVDLGGCGGAGGGTSSSSGSGSTGSGSPGSSTSSGQPGSSGTPGPGSSSGVVIYEDPYAQTGCSCSGDTVGYDEEIWIPADDGGGDSYAESGYESDPASDGCASDTTDTASTDGGDDCSGDTTDSAASSGDDCGGDSSEGYDYQNDDSCSGDTGSSGSSDACGGDTGSSAGDGCSSSSGSTDADCSMARGKKRSPRMSALTLAALFVVAPVRRALRRRRRAVAPRR